MAHTLTKPFTLKTHTPHTRRQYVPFHRNRSSSHRRRPRRAPTQQGRPPACRIAHGQRRGQHQARDHHHADGHTHPPPTTAAAGVFILVEDGGLVVKVRDACSCSAGGQGGERGEDAVGLAAVAGTAAAARGIMGGLISHACTHCVGGRGEVNQCYKARRRPWNIGYMPLPSLDEASQQAASQRRGEVNTPADLTRRCVHGGLVPTPSSHTPGCMSKSCQGVLNNKQGSKEEEQDEAAGWSAAPPLAPTSLSHFDRA